MVQEDILVVVHCSRYYRFYSLPWILANCTVLRTEIGARVAMEGGREGIVGQEDFGIPITVKIEGGCVLGGGGGSTYHHEHACTRWSVCKGWREGGREGGREGWREGGRKGGRGVAV